MVGTSCVSSQTEAGGGGGDKDDVKKAGHAFSMKSGRSLTCRLYVLKPSTYGLPPPPDFTAIAPADGKLKQFVVGTGTAASALYAQRRLNVGTPGAMVTYTPIARPTNATARCIFPT